MPHEVTRSLREANPASIGRSTALGFRCQVHGTLKIELDALVDRAPRRFMGDGAAYCWVAMNQAIADAGLDEKDISNPRTGLIVGSGGPDHRRDRAAPPITTEKGAQAGRAVRGAQGDVVHLLGQSLHLVQDQGRQLFHHLGLLDLGQLHRQRRRDDPVGQAGHDVRRRRRGAGLDAVGTVRRHGRDVVEIQRHAGKGLPRL